jgi:L-amino acid N-acyltransferase YncA
MTLQIRPTTPADLPAITKIYAHAVLHGTATFELEPPDTAEMTRRYETLVAGGFPYIVAVSDGVVVGYAYAGSYRARPAYRFAVENSVYLDPAAQGKRIGTQLMQALITESEKRGYRLMVAVIGDSANLASIGVHTRAGFQMVGTLQNVGLKFGRWLDTVLMQRPLGEGAATIPKESE